MGVRRMGGWQAKVKAQLSDSARDLRAEQEVQRTHTMHTMHTMHTHVQCVRVPVWGVVCPLRWRQRAPQRAVPGRTPRAGLGCRATALCQAAGGRGVRCLW